MDLFTTLSGLLKGMNLPDFRKTQNTIHNVKWLAKNLGKFNSAHKNFKSAEALIQKIMDREGTKP